MSDKKGWGSTVAGWFIEREEPTPTEIVESDVESSAAEDVAAVSNYTTPSPTQGVFQSPPPPPTNGQVDFGAVFTAAGVDTE